MKVACIGNMNNFQFSIARYLRKNGIDADLLLLENEFDHFHPSADTFDKGYESFTRQVAWGDLGKFASTPPEVIRDSIRGYDAFITCDSVPAYLRRIGLDSDIFVPHGSDLFQYPFYRVGAMVKLDHQMLRFNRAQREGVRRAKKIFWGETTENLDRYIMRLRLLGELVSVPVPLVYTPEFNPQTISSHYGKSVWYEKFKALRDAHDLVIVHHARHIWNSRARFPWNQQRLELHYKSNDNLIRGFAQFAKSHRELRPCLITFEYGGDVAATKDLIRELEIDEQVKWFPKMPRKEIMVCLSLADIGTGEFFGGWSHAGVIFETLAMGKPLFHYVKKSGVEQYRKEGKAIYPFINVRTAEEIAGAFEDFQRDRLSYQRMGTEGASWFQHQIIDVAVSEYLRTLKGL